MDEAEIVEQLASKGIGTVNPSTDTYSSSVPSTFHSKFNSANKRHQSDRSKHPAIHSKNDRSFEREEEVVSGWRVSGEGFIRNGSVRKTAFPLVVGIATKERAGKYACKPHGGMEAATRVHVNILEGE